MADRLYEADCGTHWIVSTAIRAGRPCPRTQSVPNLPLHAVRAGDTTTLCGRPTAGPTGRPWRTGLLVACTECGDHADKLEAAQNAPATGP